MTSDEYGKEGCCEAGKVLEEMHGTLKSIDGKVDEILDELRDHFEAKGSRNGEWSVRDLYNGENEY